MEGFSCPSSVIPLVNRLKILPFTGFGRNLGKHRIGSPFCLLSPLLKSVLACLERFFSGFFRSFFLSLFFRFYGFGQRRRKFGALSRIGRFPNFAPKNFSSRTGNRLCRRNNRRWRGNMGFR